MPVTDLEPVNPDPKKLRRTAFILVAIMCIGGFIILTAYQKHTQEGAKDDRPNLAFQISETKDLRFVRQDGQISDLMALNGKILVVQVLPLAQRDPLTIDVMKRVAERFRDREDVALVTLLLDPGPAEGLTGQLEEMADQLGAGLPQWTVASNDRPTLHRFIKNEFKATRFPHEKDGRWIYDSSIVLIDHERHLRRAVIPQKRGGAPFVTPFDFEQAQEWDAKGIRTGIELNHVEQMEVLLNETIETLLKEKEAKS